MQCLPAEALPKITRLVAREAAELAREHEGEARQRVRGAVWHFLRAVGYRACRQRSSLRRPAERGTSTLGGGWSVT